MGDQNSVSRIFDRFRIKASSVCRHTQYRYIVKPYFKTVYFRRGSKLVRKRCYRMGIKRTGPRRIFQSSFSNSKERGRYASDTERKASKQLCQERKVQNANSKNNSTVTQHGGLGRKNRSKGCLLSNSCTSRPQKISEIFSESSDLPIQNSLFWPDISTEGVYKSHVSIGGIPSLSSSENCSVSRRLDYLRRQSEGCRNRNSKNSTTVVGSRTSNKLGEVYSGSDTENRISGNGNRLEIRHSKTIPGKVQSSGLRVRKFSTRVKSTCKKISQFIGTDDRLHRHSPVGSSIYASNPALPAKSLAASHARLRHTDSSTPEFVRTSELVVETRKCVKGQQLKNQKSRGSNDNRCLKSGLGSSHGQRSSERQLAPQISRTKTHKLVRNEGCVSGPETFPGKNSGQSCSSKIRQFDSDCILDKNGRDKIPRFMLPHMGSPELVSQSEYHLEGSPYSRSFERDSRQVIKRQPDKTHRVVAFRDSGPSDISKTGPTSGGPVCNKAEQKMSDILFTSARSECPSHRCIHDFMGRNAGICLSTPNPLSESDKKDKSRGLCDNSDSPTMAEAGMVSRSLGSDDSPTSKVARRGRLAFSGQREACPSRSKSSKISSLETVKKGKLKKGFSARAASIMASARRSSTTRTYDARLKRFYSWCEERNTDPSSASVTQISDFLQQLFDKHKFSPTTIAGYRSAISLIHKGVNGVALGQDKDLSDLISGMSKLRPRKRILTPNWSLPLVLNMLTKAPFEPLSKTTMKYLTLKTVFLVAVTSGRRVSEIHALSSDENHFRWEKNGKGVRLLTNREFLAKNESLKNPGQDIFLASFDQFSSSDEENLMCPCRALAIYLNRTKAVREGNTQLFLTHKKGDVRKPSKDTIARWIVETIKTCYQLAGNEDVLLAKAHDTRSLASSWALFQGVNLEEIMRAAFWNSDTTFTTFYLRDVVWDDAMFSLATLGTVRAGKKHKKRNWKQK